MKIVRTSREDMGSREMYYYTSNPRTQKMSDRKGETISFDNFVLYDSSNNDEKEKLVLSVKSGEEYIATNSATFIREFMNLVDLFQNDPNDKFDRFIVESGISGKNAREYITCLLA